MKKIIISSAICALVSATSPVFANDLAYMIHPTAKNYQIPTKVETVEKEGTTEITITYEMSAQNLNAIAPAAGPDSTGKASYDHLIGH